MEKDNTIKSDIDHIEGYGVDCDETFDDVFDGFDEELSAEIPAKNRKMKLHPGVYYRAFDDLVVLYHTGQQKVFTFNETVGDILDCFAKSRTDAAAIELLKRIYESDDEKDEHEFVKSIRAFIDKLVDLDILLTEHRQIEVANSLEQEISRSLSDKAVLYSATMELTYKCNEKCRHCYVVDEGRTEMPTGKIKAILDELADLNVFNIVFTGGEVFARADAFEILEHAYAKRFVVDIFTNGTLLTAESILKLKALWPRCIHFSVYSHIAEKHDAITQVRGSFEKTLSAIKACVLVGLQVNIKTPIFSETMEDISELVKLANSLGVSIGLGNNITPKKNGDLSPVEMKVTGRANNDLVFAAIKALIEADNADPNDKARSEKLCNAGERSISINPYGEVFPCSVLPLCVGDVSGQALKQIWEESDTLNWWRENNLRSHRKGCSDCGLAERCVFCPGEAMMRTGDPVSRYEEACLATKYAVTRESERGGETREEIR